MKRWLFAFMILALSGYLLAQGFVVDHTCTDIHKIPDRFILQAKANLRVGYSHTSHGSQLVTGISAFKGAAGSLYDFTMSSWGLVSGTFLNDLWANAAGGADLGHTGDLTWRDATLTMLTTAGNDRNVVMWSWCGGCSDNTNAGIDAYLNAMNTLEQQYPGVKFIYMTGHLDGSGTSGTLNLMNQRIRNYCVANNKILFDFADIESYAPGSATNVMALYATDGCEYDANGDGNPWGDANWAQNWMIANPEAEMTRIVTQCSDCAHSEKLNCILKGRALWYLLARLAGWNGVPRAASDFNTDGKADLVWRNIVTGDHSIWLMNGAQWTANLAGLPSVAASWSIAGLADFNNDGKPDIFWRNAATGDNSIWLMNGSSPTGSAAFPNVPAAWQVAGFGDFDLDGKPDLLWRNSTSGVCVVWYLNGTALKGQALAPAVGTAWSVAAVADFNDDGRCDLLWRNPATGANSLWLMNGVSLFAQMAFPSAGTDWEVAAAGDYNNDGYADVLWRNITAGTLSVWYLVRGGYSSGAPLYPGGVGDLNWRIVRH